jgi:hypothetical protein
MSRALVLIGALVLGAVLAAPVGANPPTSMTVTQQVSLVDETACGTYGVRWNIDLTADVRTFFDNEGRRTMVVAHVTEDNTVQNTVTGLTLRDGPVNFVQTTTFDPETGRRLLIEIVGTSAHVRRGNELLIDTGRIVIDGQTLRILESSGPHPLRELLDGSGNTALALPGFCDILR